MNQDYRTLKIGGEPSIKALAGVLKALNKAFKQPDDTFAFGIAGNYTRYYVNQTRTNIVQLSQELSLSGEVAMGYNIYVPGWSVTLPYCRAGVQVSPEVSATVEGGAIKDGKKNPVVWNVKGGVRVGGSVGGGLGLYVGERNVIRVDASIQGRVGVSGEGTFQTPGPMVKVAYNVGKLVGNGQLKVTLSGQPILTYQIERTLWEGIKGEYPADLSPLFKL